MPHFRFQIVITGLWPDLDLFDLKRGLLLFGFLLFFGLLVLEPAVVHDLTDRWFRVGRNLYEIEAMIIGFGQGLMNRKNADLISVRINQANFPYPDILIDPRGIRLPSIELCFSGTSYTFTSCCAERWIF
jgi:hypothetical protein